MIDGQSVWLVICDDGNSQVDEIDVDSIWASQAAANERMQQITDARRVGVERRIIGEIGIAYH